MKRLKYMALTAMAAAGLALAAPALQAQVSITIGPHGGPPDCPYGYFDYAPYACAPYGYYGPEWFLGGVFIGAGPWFHGPRDFRGHVDEHFSPQYGYHGALPHRGDRALHQDRAPRNFHGHEMRDGRGNGDHGHGDHGH